MLLHLLLPAMWCFRASLLTPALGSLLSGQLASWGVRAGFLLLLVLVLGWPRGALGRGPSSPLLWRLGLLLLLPMRPGHPAEPLEAPWAPRVVASPTVVALGRGSLVWRTMHYSVGWGWLHTRLLRTVLRDG